MTDVNDDEATIIEPSNTISVGEQLRLAREEKKFTIAEVAAQLRLTRHTITHLEAEEWGKLHGRAYARGYFSNYVKFLGLPEDELLTAFNIEYKATEESLPPVAKQSLKNHKTAWILGAVTISMVFIIGITYQQWQASTDTDDNSTVSQWDRLNDAMDIFNASVVEPLSDSEQKIFDVGEEVPANEEESSEQQDQDEQDPVSEMQEKNDSEKHDPVAMNSLFDSPLLTQADVTEFILRQKA